MIVKVRATRLKEVLVGTNTKLAMVFAICPPERWNAQMVEHPDYRYRIASSHQTLSNLVRVS